MTEAYRIAKREVEVEVTVIGRPPETLHLFLAAQAETHSGYERPSDLLNAPGRFLPARDAHGTVLFLQRDALLSLSVPRDSEFPPDDGGEEEGMPGAARVPVAVTLLSGATLRGIAAYVMPEGRARLQDFLNLPDRFLVLRHQDRVTLINKSQIACAEALPGGG